MTTHPRTHHHVGDIVALINQHYPKGVVRAELPDNNVAVQWPSTLWTRHHSRELTRIV